MRKLILAAAALVISVPAMAEISRQEVNTCRAMKDLMLLASFDRYLGGTEQGFVENVPNMTPLAEVIITVAFKADQPSDPQDMFADAIKKSNQAFDSCMKAL